jgi:hypothetical protein
VGNTITNNGGECDDTGVHVYSLDQIRVNNNVISGNDNGVINNAEGTLDAARNYWGAASGPFNAATNPDGTGDTVGDNVTYVPFDTDPAPGVQLAADTENPQVGLTTLDPVTVNVPGGVMNGTIDVSGLVDGLSGVLPELTINATTSAGTITVQIPAGTTVTGGAGWNGIINVPTVQLNTARIAGGTLQTTVELGFGDIPLTFDNAVRILFPGQAGRLIGYTRGGVFTAITNTCTPSDDSQATGNLLPAAGDCKLDVGADLVVWTKHFTSFVTYTPSSGTNGGGSGGGGGGGGSGATTTTTPPATTTTPTTTTTTQTPFAQEIDGRVVSVVTDPSDFASLQSLLGVIQDQTQEAKYKLLITQDVKTFFGQDVTFTASSIQVSPTDLKGLVNFVVYGISFATANLGAGERRALLRDYFETVGRLPKWLDIERLAEGMKPIDRNLDKEKSQANKALVIFKKITGFKAPNFKDAKDDLAWNTMMYRVRFTRDTAKEKSAIIKFKQKVGRTPSSPLDWAAVRALGYVY